MSRITIITANSISTASVDSSKTKQSTESRSQLDSVLVNGSKGVGKLRISLEMKE
jgi:hypothetical protein